MGGGGAQTSYQTNIPPYLEGPTKELVGRGMELVRGGGFTPYSPYASVAPLSQSQMAAGAETRNLSGQARFTPQAAQYYRNPYTQGVTDIGRRQAIKDAQMMQRDLSGQAARAGAFGGSRFGLQENALRSDLGQRLSDIQTRGDEAAYRDAQAQFERDRGETYRRIGQLGNIGRLERGVQQDIRDRAREQFEKAQDYDFRQLERARSLISGLPYSSTQQTSTGSPSAFNQIAGLGLAGLGAYNTFGGPGR